jgi:hypothetical protein
MARNWDDREDRFEAHPVRESAKGISLTWVVSMVAMALVLVTAGILWGLGVFTADAKGRGDAYKQIHSGTNRIAQYDRFFQLDADIRTYAEQAAAAKQKLDEFNKQYPPSSTEAFNVSEMRTNLQNNQSGPEQLCRTDVNDYNNASAATYTQGQFKASSLPWNYDVAVCTDPSKLPMAPPAPTN